MCKKVYTFPKKSKHHPIVAIVYVLLRIMQPCKKIAVLLAALISLAAHAQPVKLSLWTPIAIPRYDSLSTTNAALGVEYKVHNLNGVGVAAVFGRHMGNVNGVAVSGIAGITTGKFSGVGLSTIGNIARDSAAGVQLAGLFNMSLSHMYGLQLSPMNFSIGDVRGAQLTGTCNLAAGEINGLQLSGAMNIANRGARAVQVASFVNMCLDTLRGGQLAVGNYCGDLYGVQLGLANMCNGRLNGVQVGIINYSNDTTSFRKLGLVNLNPHTRYDVVLLGGNMVNAGLAMRFCNKYTYTMLGIEFPSDRSGNVTAALFYRFGGRIPVLGRRLFLNPDVGYMHLFHGGNDGDVREFSLQARLSVEYKVLKWLGVFATGGYAWTSEYKRPIGFSEKILAEGGVSFRLPKNSK